MGGGGGRGAWVLWPALSLTPPHWVYLLMIAWGITSEGHKKEYYYQ